MAHGRLSVDEYIQGIRDADRVVLSRAITLVESARPEDRELADALMDACLPFTGRSLRIGITGVPGAGKSSLIEVLGLHVLEAGHRLAVLAVDPSSERTKGSILGDKTRMERLTRDSRAYVRPSPTGGTLGGVTQATREAMLLCEAAGFDVVFVETTGVGQSEYSVRDMVDFFLLLALSGAGDDLQGIKRGIMEVVDAVVLAKADGTNREAAEQARAMYQNVLDFLYHQENRWRPRALTCSAAEHRGIEELWNVVTSYFQYGGDSGLVNEQRKQQARSWMYQAIHQRLREDFYGDPRVHAVLPQVEAEVTAGQANPRAAAERLLGLHRKGV